MWKKQVSPKIQKAAEEYLASLNSSRERLTDAQWEVFVNHVKTERQFRWAIPFILVMGTLLACMTVFFFHKTSEYITYAVPEHVVYVTTEFKKSPLEISPERIRGYLEDLSSVSGYSIGCLLNTTLFFMIIVIRFITRKQRRRYIEALVMRKETDCSSSIG